MPIKTECLDCGAKWKVGDHRAGQILDCPHCGGEVEVPGRPRGARGSARPAHYDDGYDDDWEGEYGAGGGARSGVPIGVWIGAGAGGVALLVIILIFALSGGDDEKVADNNKPSNPNAWTPTTPGGGNPPRTNLNPKPRPAEYDFKAHSEWRSEVSKTISDHERVMRDLLNETRKQMDQVVSQARTDDPEYARELYSAYGDFRFRSEKLSTHPAFQDAMTAYVQKVQQEYQKFELAVAALKNRKPKDPRNLLSFYDKRLDDALKNDEKVLTAVNSYKVDTGQTGGVTGVPDAAKSDGITLIRPGGPELTSHPIPDYRPGLWDLQVTPNSVSTEVPADYSLSLRIGQIIQDKQFVDPTHASPFVMLGPRDVPGQALSVYDLRDGSVAGNVRSLSKTPYASEALSADGKHYAIQAGGQVGLSEIKPNASPSVAKLDLFSPDRIQIVGGRIYVSGFGRKLAAWDVKEFKYLGQLEYTNGLDRETVVFSPGGRYLAGYQSSEKKLTIFDLNTAQVVASAPVPTVGEKSHQCKALSFSDDGKFIATIFTVFGGNTNLLIWRTSNGQIESRMEIDKSVRIPFRPEGRPIQWFGDGQHLLLFHRYVIDFKNPAAKYTMTSNKKVLPLFTRVMGKNHIVCLQHVQSGGSLFKSIPLKFD